MIKKVGGVDYLGLSVCAALAVATALTSYAPRVELQATTVTGELFVAGVGDTCADAFNGAVIPADWRNLDCVSKSF